MFDNISAAIPPLQTLLSVNNEKAIKLLNLHAKTFKTYLEKSNENSTEMNTMDLNEDYIEDENFIEWK